MSRPGEASQERRWWWVWAGVVFLYVASFPYHPAMRSPNELCRLWQTRALVEYGTLDINQALRDYGPVGDLSVKDGKYYPSKAPLLSFAAVPLYKLLSLWGGGGRFAVGELPLVYWSRFWFTVLPTLVMLLFAFRFLRAYLPADRVHPLLVTYALGSMAFNYSLMFLSHQTTAVLAFGTFYSLWRTHRRDWGLGGYLAAGAFGGATVACEYTGALAVLGLGAYAVMAELEQREFALPVRFARILKGAGLAVLGGLPFVLGLMAYHQHCFGHPLVSGYKYLNDPGYQPWHMGGFLGIHFPDPRAFILSFFSPLRGLFTLSPFLLLSFAGLVLWRRTRRAPERSLFWLVVILTLGYAYFTSSFSYDSWGWAAGPRHMTPLLPFLLLPAGMCLEWLSVHPGPAAAVGRGVAAGLCALSVLISGTVTFVNYIPGDVSTSVFGLCLPLFFSGYLSPSVMNFLGVANPLAGGLLWAFVGLAALCVGASLLVPTRDRAPATEQRLSGVAVGSALAVVMLHLGLLYAATPRASDSDLHAQSYMRSVWLAPPGKAVTFWPKPIP